MLIELSAPWIIGLNVGGWLGIQLGLARLFLRLPAEWFEPPPPRSWEAAGTFYERWFGIRRWKDWLPDAAGWFGGGVAKRSLIARDTAALRRFAQETRRAELCHAAAIACAPVFFLWNPWWADLIIVAYALAANLPCIVTQRYNRARLHRHVSQRPR